MGARFYLEHMAAGGVDGIPKGSLYAANLITDAGVQGSAKRFQGRQAFDEGRAAYAVNLNLAHSAQKPFPMKNNPVSLALGKKYYQAGLGDDTSDMNANLSPDPAVAAAAIEAQGWGPITYTAPSAAIAAPDPGGSSSSWVNVLNTASAKNIFAGISTGLANLIGGKQNPTTVIASQASSMPSIGTMLLLGLAIGVPAFLFLRKK